MEEDLGTVCWWGLSPALDLRPHLPPEPPEAAALLVGGAEGRHLLLTAARARRGPPRDITLYVAEQHPEAVARQLLFLLLALEPPGPSGAAARAAAVLELVGSLRVRAGTAALLGGAARRLRRWVTGDRHREGPPEGGGPAELGLMKSRDRDALESVLRRWEGPVPVPEPRGWEQRLRRRLRSRYEARAAVADWDLRMALHPRGATSVTPPEFGRWRESGVAFVPRGGGDVPNPTLRSERHPRADGKSGPESGFWGDTVTGPFLIFGLEPPPGSSGKSATEISLDNVTALLEELLRGGHPPPQPGDPPPGSPPPPGDRDPPGDPPRDDTDPLGPLAPLPLRIRFLPLGSARRPPPRLGGLCRLLVLGWRSLPELTPELGAWAAPGATLLVELPTFVPTLRPPQLDVFRARVGAQARESGFQPWGGPGEPPAYARFRRAPPAPQNPDPPSPTPP